MKTLIYFTLCLSSSYLFLFQSTGVNLFILDLFILSLFLFKDKYFYRSKSLLFAFILLLITSLSSILYGNLLSILAHIFSFSVLAIKLHAPKTSTFTAYCLGVSKGVMGGMLAVIELDLSKMQQNKKKWHKKLIMVLIPSGVCLIFALLYGQSDSQFGTFFRSIKLPFISIEEFIFTFVFSWLAYPLFFHSGFFNIEQKDISYSNETKRSSLWTKLMNKELEFQTAFYSFIALNFMLAALILMEVYTLFFGPEINPLELSAHVHQGVGTLVFSLVLAILILMVFLQGRIVLLGKYQNLKVAALVWLILNTFLVILTAQKNISYVAEMGLTYKRIGVFIYLILCSSGLFISYLKINRNKSVYFVYRQFGLAFWAVFSISTLIPWNTVICVHNLQMADSKVDLNYLESLGYESYPYLMEYKPQYVKDAKMNGSINYFIQRYEESNWQSYNWMRSSTYHKIKAITKRASF